MEIPVKIVKESPLRMRAAGRMAGIGVLMDSAANKVVEVHKFNPSTGTNEVIFRDPDYKK